MFSSPEVPDVEDEQVKIDEERKKKRERKQAKRAAEGQERVRRSQGARTVLTRGQTLGGGGDSLG